MSGTINGRFACLARNINTYDAASNVSTATALSSPGATELFRNEYAYDPLERMKSVKQYGLQAGVGVAEKLATFTYNLAGQFDTIARYANLVGTQLIASSTYGYDLAARLTSLVHTAGSGGTLNSYAFAYDSADRITGITTQADGLAAYTYDMANQVTNVDYVTQTDESPVWDLNGNRANVAQGQVVGTNNQQLSDGTFNYTYDAEGNRASKTRISNGEFEAYTWDHRNRLTKITFRSTPTGPITKTVEHTYDAFNRWIKMVVDADGETGSAVLTETYFVYQGTNISFQIETTPGASWAAGVPVRHRYLWGPGQDQILADEQITTTNFAGNVITPLADHLGTVRDLVDRNDSTGQVSVVNHRLFSLFGYDAGESNPTIDHLFGLAGRPIEEHTHLSNNLNRWLDGWLDRFVSEDPIGFMGGDTNLNRYVGNHPTIAIDPDGLAEVNAQSLFLDLVQIGLDIGGIFEPTPGCDGTNTVISLFRFQWLDAGINALGMIPYFGDAAKLAKLPKYLNTIGAVTELAIKNSDFAKRTRPVLEEIGKAINNLPDWTPKWLRDDLNELV